MRPLSETGRHRLAEYLRAVADELTAGHAADVQRLLGEAQEYGYPTATSGGSGNRSNRTDDDGHPIQPDTVPERLAIHPDRPARDAEELVRRLRRIEHELITALAQLGAWNPNRAVAICHRCKHPLQRGFTRCQRMIDGRQCGASEEHQRVCGNPNCGKVMEPGEYLRGGRCEPCAAYWRRNGRERIPTEAMALGDNVQVTT